MIIQTTKTLEELRADARATMRKLIDAGLFSNPNLKAPEGITAFCGPLKDDPRFQQSVEPEKIILDLRNLMPSKKSVTR